MGDLALAQCLGDHSWLHHSIVPSKPPSRKGGRLSCQCGSQSGNQQGECGWGESANDVSMLAMRERCFCHSYPAARAVLQRPSLNGTTLRLSHDAGLRSISPGDTVDLPLAALALELKGVIDTLLVGGEGNSAECGGECLVLSGAGNSRAHDKTHYFVGVKVWVDVGDLSIRLECDILVLESTEVNDYFPALGH